MFGAESTLAAYSYSTSLAYHNDLAAAACELSYLASLRNCHLKLVPKRTGEAVVSIAYDGHRGYKRARTHARHYSSQKNGDALKMTKCIGTIMLLAACSLKTKQVIQPSQMN